MLSSISPVGEAARGQRWGLTVSAYLVGSTLGGLALGALAGGVGELLPALPGRWPLAVLAVTAAGGLLLDAAGRVPSLHRQVDRAWLETYRGWVYGIGFGVQLGVGLSTIVPRSVTWLLVVAAGLTGDVAAGALLGGIFGLVRGLPILLAGGARTPGKLRRLLARVDALRDRADTATSMAQAAVALVALGGLLL